MGGNAEASRLAGINTEVIRILTFIVCGFFVALAAMMLVARAGSTNSLVGAGTEFDCITAAVLGGVSMSGGEGKIWKVFVATMILGILSNGMQFIGLGVYPQYVAKGVILILAISFDAYSKTASVKKDMNKSDAMV